MSLQLLLYIGLAVLGVAGVAEIIRKGLRGPRALSRHRPDARDMAHRPALNDRKAEAIGHKDAITEQQAEQARHRRSLTERAKADAKAARARRLRPWDHH